MFGKQLRTDQFENDDHTEKQTQYQEQPHILSSNQNLQLLNKQLHQGDTKQRVGMFPSINDSHGKKQVVTKSKKQQKLPLVQTVQAQVLDNRSKGNAKKQLFPHFKLEDEEDQNNVNKKELGTKVQAVCEKRTQQSASHQQQSQTIEQRQQEVQIAAKQMPQPNENIKDEKQIIAKDILNQKIDKNCQKIQQQVSNQQQNSQLKTSIQQPQSVPQPILSQTKTTNQLALQSLTPQQTMYFSPTLKSPTIECPSPHTHLTQSSFYYQNKKLALSAPITSLNSFCRFRVQNIKYCIGFGVGLQQVIEKHGYDYQSQGNKQLNHGLYIVTSQGFSWSHSEKEEDDVFRAGFNCLYNGAIVQVRLQGEVLSFRWKKGQFVMNLPYDIRNKYQVCYCVYLHDKTDAVSISG